ncbi:MAG: hypothetical protein DRG63_00850 [Deltaproteobacteria bacterium]|nr:MAG: hypothetical protein DRG63_00850 [Deltaproteobacteria bacterium]RLB19696.1 MAG: hypothetical protein DRG76_12285 [Deltaproteobacteria bacterium]
MKDVVVSIGRRELSFRKIQDLWGLSEDIQFRLHSLYGLPNETEILYASRLLLRYLLFGFSQIREVSWL